MECTHWYSISASWAMTISVSGKKSPSHQITRLELKLLKCILWRTLLVNNPLLDFTQIQAVDLPGQCDKLSFCEEHSLLATSTCGTVSLAIRPPRREWLVLDQCGAPQVLLMEWLETMRRIVHSTQTGHDRTGYDRTEGGSYRCVEWCLCADLALLAVLLVCTCFSDFCVLFEGLSR